MNYCYGTRSKPRCLTTWWMASNTAALNYFVNRGCTRVHAATCMANKSNEWTTTGTAGTTGTTGRGGRDRQAEHRQNIDRTDRRQDGQDSQKMDRKTEKTERQTGIPLVECPLVSL